MLRYLRIAVVGVGLTACVLVSALRVRSYWWLDGIVRDRRRDVISVVTEPGAINIESEFYPANEMRKEWRFVQEPLPEIVPSPVPLRRPLVRQIHADWWSVIVPHSHLAFVCGTIVALPWVRWSRSFSVRTFLVAATYVAAWMGLLAQRW